MTRAHEHFVPGPAWSETTEEAVRPYALTGGRTTPRYRLRLVSALTAGSEAPPDFAPPEAALVMSVCHGQDRSVAEIAATIRQPVLVTKILISDLLDAGALIMAVPHETTDSQDPAMLEALLVGLRRKFNL